jgi:hypothetical protein
MPEYDDPELRSRIATLDADPRVDWVDAQRDRLAAAWESRTITEPLPAAVEFDTIAEPLVSRSTRSRRDRWLVAAAAAVAAVLVIAGIVLLQETGGDHIRSTPAAPGPAPTTTTPPTTDPAAYVAVADSIMAAWVAGDGDGVVALFVDPDHPLNEVGIGSVEVPGGGVPSGGSVGFPGGGVPSGTGNGLNWAFDDVAALPAVHDWFRALGWQFRREPCRLSAVGFAPDMPVADSASVVCNYTYENDLTRAVGRAPVPGQFVLMVVGDKVAKFIGGGVFAGGMFDLDADIWQTFSDWVRSEHADDFAAMYTDTAPPAPRLDEASIALWDRHVGEFVSSPEAHTPPAGAPTRAQFGAKARMICATAAFEAQDGAGEPASQNAMEQLRALPRPEEDAAQIDQLFSLLEEINRRILANDWFHKGDFYSLAEEKDRLGGRDFWYCPVFASFG